MSFITEKKLCWAPLNPPNCLFSSLKWRPEKNINLFAAFCEHENRLRSLTMCGERDTNNKGKKKKKVICFMELNDVIRSFIINNHLLFLLLLLFLLADAYKFYFSLSLSIIIRATRREHKNKILNFLGHFLTSSVAKVGVLYY